MTGELFLERFLWSLHYPEGLLTERDLTGYHILVLQEELESGVVSIVTEFDVHPGTTKSAPPPAILNNVGCGTSVDIVVQAMAGLRIGYYSAPLRITGHPCTGNGVLTVTVDQIIVGDGSETSITDNDPCVLCTDRRLELYGALIVSHSRNRNIAGPTGHNGPEFGGCPDRTRCAKGGVYTFGNPDPNQRLFWNEQFVGIGPDANRTLTITVDLYDYAYRTYLAGSLEGSFRHFSNDPASYRWCRARLTLPGRSAIEWERFVQTFHLRDTNPKGNCDVTVHVQGFRP